MAIAKSIRDSFVAGLILVLPLIVTILVLKILFGWTVGVINPLVQAADVARYTANIELVAQVVTIVFLLAIVTLLGFLVQIRIGRKTVSGIGDVVGFIPVFRSIYTSVRQVADALVNRSTEYETVVLVEYPREGIFKIGFLTGDPPDVVSEHAGQGVYNVYMPASPNPTAGSLVMVAEEHVYESDLSVRQGLRMLMTTGIATTEKEMEEKDLTGVDQTALLERQD